MLSLSVRRNLSREIEEVNGPGKNQKRRWLTLFAWIFLLYVFVFLFAPWLQRHNRTMERLGAYIRESGIDAGALYYTEVGEVGEADLAVRDTLRFYLPAQKGEGKK